MNLFGRVSDRGWRSCPRSDGGIAEAGTPPRCDAGSGSTLDGDDDSVNGALLTPTLFGQRVRAPVAGAPWSRLPGLVDPAWDRGRAKRRFASASGCLIPGAANPLRARTPPPKRHLLRRRTRPETSAQLADLLDRKLRGDTSARHPPSLPVARIMALNRQTPRWLLSVNIRAVCG